MRRQLFLTVACVALLFAYRYALIWVFGYEAALPMPRWWSGLFPSRISVRLWIVLAYTMTLILVSVPVAALVARFGGRHAIAVALLMALALFVVTVAPTLAEDVGAFAHSPHAAPMLLIQAFGYVSLVAMLPLLVWLFRRLPSSDRWRGT